MKEAVAPAKINLALVVGPPDASGYHRVATVLERLDLADTLTLEPAARLDVSGFERDTLVRKALAALAERATVEPGWAVHIEKRIPVASGLGGGSSDAAAALRLANETLKQPLRQRDLHKLALAVGADVPFFLREGPYLARGHGGALRRVSLPRDYRVLLVLPADTKKPSTKAVYDAFDLRGGERGFEDRRTELFTALEARDLAALPPNDLASSPLADELRKLGAFRADVSGAGPTVYGLFTDPKQAEAARAALANRGQTWLARPTR